QQRQRQTAKAELLSKPSAQKRPPREPVDGLLDLAAGRSGDMKAGAHSSTDQCRRERDQARENQTDAHEEKEARAHFFAWRVYKECAQRWPCERRHSHAR